MFIVDRNLMLLQAVTCVLQSIFNLRIHIDD